MLCTVRHAHAIGAILVLLALCAPFTGAQTLKDARPSLTVTATTTTDGVRFAAVGETTEMRLEIYAAGGGRVFDTGLRKGALLDWNLKDGQPPVPDGSYFCVLTYRDLRGHLSQKYGGVLLESGRVTALSRLDKEQLRSAQAQALSTGPQTEAIEPAAEDDAVTILPDSAPSIAVVTHDGETGQVTSTTGALTFRTGNVFNGQEREQMRLTEDGRLGIGTRQPEATLDVAGTIRARGGIVFQDGTTLTSASRADRTDRSGPVEPNAAGTGTLNFIPKWTETGGAGTLGNSVLFEAPSGFIGIGTQTPPHPFSVRRNGGTLGVHSVGELFVDRDNNTRSASLTVGTAGVLKWIFGMPSGGDGFQVYDLVSNQSRFFVHPSSGNIGVGMTTPLVKLDVAGAINTTAHYSIGGLRALSIPGLNTFAGAGAGTSNTGDRNTFVGYMAGSINSGNNNSFFGMEAGDSNTTGSNNSFFGTEAGDFNTTGSQNAFFGTEAGQSNVSGSDNSFFGYHAGSLNTATGNAFFGAYAGAINTGGRSNSFFGSNAGLLNATTSNNSFFGYRAGYVSTGSNNSFFGSEAGDANQSGDNNSFFGTSTGSANTTGDSNSFFGYLAGVVNTSGTSNSFVGTRAGDSNTTGSSNTFVGTRAGDSNTTGSGNTYIGREAAGATDHTNATAIGYRAFVSESNSLVLGSINGINDANADTYVGIGTTNPVQPLQVKGLILTEGLALRIGSEPDNCVVLFGRPNGDILVNKQACLFGNDGRTGKPATIDGANPAPLQSLLDKRAATAGGGTSGSDPNVRLADALKQQQEQIKQQQAQIEGLKKLVCQDHPDADVCR